MDYQIWAASRLGRVDLALRKEITFFAPLTDSLEFYGIEPAAFARASVTGRIGRDGQAYGVGTNVPRFDYSGEIPLGIHLSAGTTLQFSAANGLDSSGPTLTWFENNIAKSTPANGNPISSTGHWIGNLNVNVKYMAKARRTLTTTEIATLQGALNETPVTPPVEPPPPPAFEVGVWVKEVPSGVRNGTNKIFTLSQFPELDSLLVMAHGIVCERVAATPGNMEFTVGGGLGDNRIITMGMAPAATGAPFWAQYTVA